MNLRCWIWFCFTVTLVLRGQPATGPLVLDHRFSPGFPVADVVWDVARGRGYGLDTDSLRVKALRLADGTVEAEYPLTRRPERGFLRPDGRFLYVTLPHRAHDDYWFDPHTGSIAEINLEDGSVREFDIDRDPYALVATDAGWVAVSDGSGQWTAMASYNAATGAKVNEVFIRQRCNLALHPSQTRLYSADTDSGPSQIQRWTLNASTGELSGGDPAPNWWERPFDGDVAVHPGGDWLVVRGGAFYTTTMDPALDMQWGGSLDGGLVERVSFDPARGAMFTVGWLHFGAPPQVSYYGPSFSLLASWPMEAQPDAVAAIGDFLYVAVPGEIRAYVSPALGAETNLPPTADFQWAPRAPTTAGPIRVDASLSSDDQGPGVPLLYRWDLNGDGSFEVPFSTNAQAEVRFNLPGDHTVTLEVEDAWGVRRRVGRTLAVSWADDPGMVPPPNAPFWVPGVVTEAAWDFPRQRLYALDTEGRRMLTVDLETGLTLRAFEFLHLPTRAVLTPDGQWLYVVLLTEPYNLGHDGSGFIAEFDLTRGVKTREFPVPLNPTDIKVTRDRIVVLYGTSRDGSELHSYDGATGRQLGGLTAAWPGALALDPADRFVLLCQNGGSEIAHFEIQAGSGELIARPDRSLSLADWVNTPIALDSTGTRLATANGRFIDIEQPNGMVLGLLHRLERPPYLTRLAFDAPPRQVFFGLQDDRLRAWQHESGFPFAEVQTPPGTGLFGVASAWIYCLAPTNSQTRLARLPNPAAGAEANQPPRARFEVFPNPPNTGTETTLDASGTTDDGAGGAALKFRWDWEGDGIYDTGFLDTPIVAHHFRETGPRTTRLAVYDAFGAVGPAEQTLAVTVQPDPGEPGPDHTPFMLPFAASDVAFDSGRNQMYATDRVGKAVVRVDLSSGRITRRWVLEQAPINLTLRPDRRRLYATMWSSGGRYMPGWGWLAEFDLEAGGMTRLIRTDVAAWDVAATDDGWLLVSGNSGDWSSIDLQRADTGERTDRLEPYFSGYGFLLDPTQDIVYAVDRGLSPSKVHRIHLDRAAGKITGVDPFPYQGDHVVEGKVFLLPGATQLLARSQAIYDASSLTFLKDLNLMIYIEDMLPVAGRPLLALVSRQQLFYLDSNTLETLATLPVADATHFLGAGARAHFLVDVYGESGGVSATVIQRRALPSDNPAVNVPPAVRLRDLPYGNQFVPGTEFRFEAAATDEDGYVTNVTFRVDDSVPPTLPSSPPWPYWTPSQWLAPGSHTLTAVAVDNQGATSAVASVTFQVVLPPTVEWLAPESDLILEAPASVVLEVNPQDSDGQVVRVEFLARDGTNAIPLGTVTQAPWRLEVPDLPRATSVEAIAYDDLGMASLPVGRSVHFIGTEGDDFYRPFRLEGTKLVATASNTEATAQPGETMILGSPVTHSLWWSWAAPFTGTVLVDTQGSSFDTLLGVYRVTSTGTFVLLEADDDSAVAPSASRLKFTALAGTEYRVLVDGYQGATGTVRLHLEYTHIPVPPPSNDDFASRTVMAGFPWEVRSSNHGTTVESGERPFNRVPGGSSVWWEWRAPTNGLATVSTRGSSFDTIITIFTAVTGSPSSPASLLVVAGNDDDAAGGLTSHLRFTTAPNRAYYIRVEGLKGAQGDLDLALDWQASGPGGRPPNDDFASPDWIVGDRAALPVSLSFATREPDETGPGMSHSAWWRWTAIHTGPVKIEATSSERLIRLDVYTGETLTSLTVPPSVSVLHVPQKSDRASFEAVAGQTYVIRAATDAADGEFILRLDAEAAPALPILTPMVLASLDILLLRYDGAATHTVVLEHAVVLGGWVPMSTNRVAPGEAFVLPRTAEPTGFFRLRLVD